MESLLQQASDGLPCAGPGGAWPGALRRLAARSTGAACRLLPPRIRYVLAWDHALCRARVAVYVRAVLGWLRRHARDDGVAGGRGGAVAIVQRYGAALNFNVHIHALVMDGVFIPDGAGGVRFCPVEAAGADDLAALLTTMARRIKRLLARRGGSDGGDGFDAPDRYADRHRPWRSSRPPPCAGSRRSVHAPACRSAAGAMASTRPTRRHPADGTPASRGSISMRAWPYRRVRVTDWSGGAGMPCGRPSGRTGCSGHPMVKPCWNCADGGRTGRRTWSSNRWSGGSVWPPWCPVPASTWCSTTASWRRAPPGGRASSRRRLLLKPAQGSPRRSRASPLGGPAETQPRNRGWAELMPHSFGFDVLACPRCPGRLTLVALIQKTAVILRILRHLGLPDELPVMRPARDPPLPCDGDDLRPLSDA